MYCHTVMLFFFIITCCFFGCNLMTICCFLASFVFPFDGVSLETAEGLKPKLASIVESTVTGELSTLKEDIMLAKENMFGRKIFETFATEFMSSHLAEGTQVSKLSLELLDMKNKTINDISLK